MDSPAARLAYTIRAAAGAGITTALWQGLNLTHGIWLAISAIVVLQPGARVDPGAAAPDPVTAPAEADHPERRRWPSDPSDST